MKNKGVNYRHVKLLETVCLIASQKQNSISEVVNKIYHFYIFCQTEYLTLNKNHLHNKKIGFEFNLYHQTLKWFGIQQHTLFCVRLPSYTYISSITGTSLTARNTVNPRAKTSAFVRFE